MERVYLIKNTFQPIKNNTIIVKFIFFEESVM